MYQVRKNPQTCEIFYGQIGGVIPARYSHMSICFILPQISNFPYRVDAGYLSNMNGGNEKCAYSEKLFIGSFWHGTCHKELQGGTTAKFFRQLFRRPIEGCHRDILLAHEGETRRGCAKGPLLLSTVACLWVCGYER